MVVEQIPSIAAFSSVLEIMAGQVEPGLGRSRMLGPVG